MAKAVKITLAVVAGVIIIMAGLQWWLGGKVKDIIEEQVTRMYGGLYSVEVGSARVNLLGRSATLRNLSMKVDSTRLESEENLGMLLDFKVDRVDAGGLNIGMIRNNKPFTLRSLDLYNPIIKIDQFGTGGHKRPSEAIDEAAEAAHEGVQEVAGQSAGAATAATSDNTRPKRDYAIDNFGIYDGNIFLRRHKADGPADYELDHIFLEVAGFSTDTTSAADRLLHWANLIYLSATRLEYTSPDGSMVVGADSILVDTRKNLLAVGSVQVQPQYSKEQFAYNNTKHSDWTQVTTGSITAYGIDLGRLATEKFIKLDSALIAGADIGSYKNRNVAQPYREKKLFFESVQQLPVKLQTGLIKLRDLNATYWEVAEGGSQPGEIHFTGLSGEFTGLTNVTGGEEYYTLDARGALMGSGHVHARFRFPVDEATNHFEVTGGLGSMPMLPLNRMVLPLAKIDIKGGQIDSFNFNMSGNRMTSTASVTLLYHDLEVEILKEEKHHANRFKERKFFSWVAKNFVIREDNPQNGKTATGSGSAQRDLNRSQFNFLWKSLLPGVKETIGI